MFTVSPKMTDRSVARREAHDGLTCVNADAGVEPAFGAAWRVRAPDVIECAQEFQRGDDAAHVVVFMRLRITEIDEQAVAQELSDVAAVAAEDVLAGLLIGQDELGDVFAVERLGEPGVVDQIAEEHRELPAFADHLRA